MNRKTFLSGFVVGALLGTVSTLVVGTTFRPVPTPPQIQYVTVSSVAESATDLEDSEMPPNSTRQFFNGNPYYIVLLGDTTVRESFVTNDVSPNVIHDANNGETTTLPTYP